MTPGLLQYKLHLFLYFTFVIYFLRAKCTTPKVLYCHTDKTKIALLGRAKVTEVVSETTEYCKPSVGFAIKTTVLSGHCSSLGYTKHTK